MSFLGNGTKPTLNLGNAAATSGMVAPGGPAPLSALPPIQLHSANGRAFFIELGADLTADLPPLAGDPAAGGGLQTGRADQQKPLAPSFKVSLASIAERTGGCIDPSKFFVTWKVALDTCYIRRDVSLAPDNTAHPSNPNREALSKLVRPVYLCCNELQTGGARYFVRFGTEELVSNISTVAFARFDSKLPSSLTFNFPVMLDNLPDNEVRYYANSPRIFGTRDLSTGQPMLAPFYENQFIREFNIRLIVEPEISINVKPVYANMFPYETDVAADNDPTIGSALPGTGRRRKGGDDDDDEPPPSKKKERPLPATAPTASRATAGGAAGGGAVGGLPDFASILENLNAAEADSVRSIQNSLVNLGRVLAPDATDKTMRSLNALAAAASGINNALNTVGMMYGMVGSVSALGKAAKGAVVEPEPAVIEPEPAVIEPEVPAAEGIIPRAVTANAAIALSEEQVIQRRLALNSLRIPPKPPRATLGGAAATAAQRRLSSWQRTNPNATPRQIAMMRHAAGVENSTAHRVFTKLIPIGEGRAYDYHAYMVRLMDRGISPKSAAAIVQRIANRLGPVSPIPDFSQELANSFIDRMHDAFPQARGTIQGMYRKVFDRFASGKPVTIFDAEADLGEHHQALVPRETAYSILKDTDSFASRLSDEVSSLSSSFGVISGDGNVPPLLDDWDAVLNAPTPDATPAATPRGVPLPPPPPMANILPRTTSFDRLSQPLSTFRPPTLEEAFPADAGLADVPPETVSDSGSLTARLMSLRGGASSPLPLPIVGGIQTEEELLAVRGFDEPPVVSSGVLGAPMPAAEPLPPHRAISPQSRPLAPEALSEPPSTLSPPVASPGSIISGFTDFEPNLMRRGGPRTVFSELDSRMGSIRRANTRLQRARIAFTQEQIEMDEQMRPSAVIRQGAAPTTPTARPPPPRIQLVRKRQPAIKKGEKPASTEPAAISSQPAAEPAAPPPPPPPASQELVSPVEDAGGGAVEGGGPGITLNLRGQAPRRGAETTKIRQFEDALTGRRQLGWTAAADKDMYLRNTASAILDRFGPLSSEEVRVVNRAIASFYEARIGRSFVIIPGEQLRAHILDAIAAYRGGR